MASFTVVVIFKSGNVRLKDMNSSVTLVPNDCNFSLLSSCLSLDGVVSRVVTCTLLGLPFCEVLSPELVGVDDKVVTFTLLGVFCSDALFEFLEVGVVLNGETSILRGTLLSRLFDDGVELRVVTCMRLGVLFSLFPSLLSRLVGVVDKVVTCTRRALGVEGVAEVSEPLSTFELLEIVVTSTLLACILFSPLEVSVVAFTSVLPG